MNTPGTESGIQEKPELPPEAFTMGAFYRDIKNAIQATRDPFTIRVFIPRRGVCTVTNENTPQGGLVMILENNRRVEPAEDSSIYFLPEDSENLGLAHLLAQRTEARERVESYPSLPPTAINPEVLKRIMGT